MAEDLAHIIRLDRESLTAAHWTDQQYQNLLSDSVPSGRTLILVANAQDGTVLGFLAARHISTEWELENVVVAMAARRKGIGATLVRECASRAEREGGSMLFLEVRERNAAARSLYTKLGFQETGRRKGYYTQPIEDAVLYSKTLRKMPISG